MGSFHQRRAAAQDARRIRGVFDVDNDLQVRLMDSYARDDADFDPIRAEPGFQELVA